jgi:membrane protease subunit (stomatin/prohibitin family)
VGLGAGLAMGQMMAQSLGQSLGQGQGAGQPEQDPMVVLERLGELFQKGILTEAEFTAKKAELLSKIR